MAISIFDDKTKPPDEEDLAMALGGTYTLWNHLKEIIVSLFPPLDIDWNYASKNSGWGLRLKQKKRAVLYMTPCQGYFLASFALGEKAVKAAHESDLSQKVLDIIDNSTRYVEGRGVRLEVHSNQDVSEVEKLARIKMAN